MEMSLKDYRSLIMRVTMTGVPETLEYEGVSIHVTRTATPLGDGEIHFRPATTINGLSVSYDEACSILSKNVGTAYGQFIGSEGL
jgi:hypothetical protein